MEGVRRAWGRTNDNQIRRVKMLVNKIRSFSGLKGVRSRGCCSVVGEREVRGRRGVVGWLGEGVLKRLRRGIRPGPKRRREGKKDVGGGGTPRVVVEGWERL